MIFGISDAGLVFQLRLKSTAVLARVALRLNIYVKYLMVLIAMTFMHRFSDKHIKQVFFYFYRIRFSILDLTYKIYKLKSVVFYLDPWKQHLLSPFY